MPIVDITEAHEDIERFVDALALNWLIAGTDAHAKNYSLLLAGSAVRLAPMYDVASALPYDRVFAPKLRMAMRIGGEYRLEATSGRHWRRLAASNGLDPDEVVARIGVLADQAPDAFSDAVGEPDVRALAGSLPARLVDRISERVKRCRAALGPT